MPLALRSIVSTIPRTPTEPPAGLCLRHLLLRIVLGTNMLHMSCVETTPEAWAIISRLPMPHSLLVPYLNFAQILPHPRCPVIQAPPIRCGAMYRIEDVPACEKRITRTQTDWNLFTPGVPAQTLIQVACPCLVRWVR